MSHDRSTWRLRPILLLLVTAAVSLGLAACGSDDDTDSSAAGDDGGAEEAPEVPYDGPEADLPTEYPEPEPGGNFTIGWQNPLGANESLAGQAGAVKATIESLGGKVITLDDQLDVDTQVSNFQQLLAQDVDAIGFFPIDPKATDPVLRQAKAQGVPVLAVEKTQSPDEPAGEIATQVWQGRDTQAYSQVQEMARLQPGGKIGVIGIAAPVPALKYWAERVEYWAEQFELEVVASAEDQTGDAPGGERAMNEILADAPELDGVIAYNDSVGLAAGAVARASGQEIPIVALNGQSDGLQGVEDGRLAADFQLDSVGIGVQAANALWTLAGDPDAELPPIVLRPPSEAITEENAAEATTWDEQIEELKAGG